MTTKLYSTKEAAEVLGVNQRRVRQFIEDGRLPATKVGWQWIIQEIDLREFAKKKRRVGRSLEDFDK